MKTQKDGDTAKREYLETLPKNLRYLGEDYVAHEEFLVPYGTEQERVPLRWERDVRVGLNLRERIREGREQRALNTYLRSQIAVMERQNAGYAERIARAEKDFRRKVEDNGELLRAKEEELELQQKANALRVENEKLRAMDELNTERREREQAELLLKNEERLRKRQLILKHKQDETIKGLDDVKAEIIKENARKQEIRKKYLELRAENALRAEEDKTLPKPDPICAFEVAEAKPVRKVYEAFDDANVLEFKDVYYKRENATGYVLAGTDFCVRKGCVTVVYTENKEKLKAVTDILNERIPLDMTLARGVVRVAERMLKERNSTKAVVDSDDVSRALAYGASIRSLCKNTERLGYYLARFGYRYEKLPKKATAMTESETSRLALAVTLATDGVKVVEDLAGYNREGVREALYKVLSLQDGVTVLVITDSADAVNSIKGARVHRI